MASRRSFLQKGGHFCAGAFAGGALELPPPAARADPQRFFVFSLVGSENPTRLRIPEGHRA